MPKYQNVKDFVQPVNIEGKRLFIRPKQVFQTSKVLDLTYFPFLEEVAEDVQLTSGITAAPVKPKVVSDESVKDLRAEIDRLTKMITDMAINTESDAAEEILEKRLADIEQKQSVFDRRQNVLKEAVETINEALKNIEQEVYFNNTFVVEEEKK
jgi:hypothetical protein